MIRNRKITMERRCGAGRYSPREMHPFPARERVIIYKTGKVRRIMWREFTSHSLANYAALCDEDGTMRERERENL